MKKRLSSAACLTNFFIVSTQGGQERGKRRESRTWSHIGVKRMLYLKYVNKHDCNCSTCYYDLHCGFCTCIVVGESVSGLPG